jgi:hypothetical protein
LSLVPAHSYDPVGSLLGAAAAPNALSPPLEAIVTHKRKEKSQIDKHIQLKADIILTGPLATSRRNAAGSLGLKLHVMNASTPGEIDAAFATLPQARAGALLVRSETFLRYQT